MTIEELLKKYDCENINEVDEMIQLCTNNMLEANKMYCEELDETDMLRGDVRKAEARLTQKVDNWLYKRLKNNSEWENSTTWRAGYLYAIEDLRDFIRTGVDYENDKI